MTSTSHRRALAALTAAGVLFGLTVPLSKVALDWLDAATLSAVRFALAAPILALAARGGLRAAATWPIAGWGAVGYGAMLLVQNLGIGRTSVTHAALIVGAVPALVAIIAAAVGRGASGPRAWSGFALALAGVVVVAGEGGSSSLVGDALVLVSAVLGALLIVAQGPLLVGRDPVAVTAVQMAAAAAVTLPLAAAEGVPATPPGATTVAAIVALVALGSVLPFALYAFGQARVPAEVAGAFVNLEPLVGSAIGALVFHEAFGAPQALGATAIVGGIVLGIERRRPPGGRGGSWSGGTGAPAGHACPAPG
jgi:drug/metabolite transporter (DMT)-like permease